MKLTRRIAFVAALLIFGACNRQTQLDEGKGNKDVDGLGAGAEIVASPSVSAVGGPTTYVSSSSRPAQASPYDINNRRAVADEPGTGKVANWEEALSWWPYRPVLRSVSFPGDMKEQLVRVPEDHRPIASEGAALHSYYVKPPKTVENTNYWGLMESGALSSSVTYYPRGDEAPPLQVPYRSERKIQVRGHEAVLIEMRKGDQGNRNWRQIIWNIAGPGGSTLHYQIGTDPTIWSEEATVGFVERMEEVSH